MVSPEFTILCFDEVIYSHNYVGPNAERRENVKAHLVRLAWALLALCKGHDSRHLMEPLVMCINHCEGNGIVCRTPGRRSSTRSLNDASL